jgi:mannose-6-phosphate isomerase-like protein (cupin superfamily)
MSFAVRRVVTGIDEHGQAVFVSDGPAPKTVSAPGGFGCAELWALAGPPADPAAGIDPRPGPFVLEPEPGGLTWRIISLPVPDQSLPREQQFLHSEGDPHFTDAKQGRHTTDTIDFEIILSGQIELELDEGCVRLGPGDCVVQRGTRHRWRVVGSEPCVYSAVMARTDPGAQPAPFDLAPRPAAAPTGASPRRVVTGLDGRGRSVFVTDGEAPGTFAFTHGAGMSYTSLFETGGAIASPLQGGDAVRPWLQLDPLGMGISWKLITIPGDDDRARIDGPALRSELTVLAPGMAATGHHDPDDLGNHRTDTIDLDIILEGDVELELPGHGSVRLTAGDCVVQRGNWHKWHNRGSGPMRMVALLVGAPIGGTR